MPAITPRISEAILTTDLDGLPEALTVWANDSETTHADMIAIVLEYAPLIEEYEDQKDFVKLFSTKKRSMTETKAGRSAIVFEATLLAKYKTLAGKLLETIVTEPTFTASFTEKLEKEEEKKLYNETKDQWTFTTLTKHGDTNYEEGTVSDLTVLEVTPKQDFLKAFTPTTKNASTMKHREDTTVPTPETPTTEEAYKAAYDQGGITEEAASILFPEQEQTTDLPNEAFTDDLGVVWLTHEGTIYPDIDNLPSDLEEKARFISKVKKTGWKTPKGLFSQEAKTIATTLKQHSDNFKQASARLSFYINRGGKKLKANKAHYKELQRAKQLLKKMYEENVNESTDTPTLTYQQGDIVSVTLKESTHEATVLDITSQRTRVQFEAPIQDGLRRFPAGFAISVPNEAVQPIPEGDDDPDDPNGERYEEEEHNDDEHSEHNDDLCNDDAVEQGEGQDEGENEDPDNIIDEGGSGTVGGFKGMVLGKPKRKSRFKPHGLREGQGYRNAVRRRVAEGSVAKNCPKCDTPIPKYPGRYPKHCPECGAALTPPADESSSQHLKVGWIVQTKNGKPDVVKRECEKYGGSAIQQGKGWHCVFKSREAAQKFERRADFFAMEPSKPQYATESVDEAVKETPALRKAVAMVDDLTVNDTKMKRHMGGGYYELKGYKFQINMIAGPKLAKKLVDEFGVNASYDKTTDTLIVRDVDRKKLKENYTAELDEGAMKSIAIMVDDNNGTLKPKTDKLPIRASFKNKSDYEGFVRTLKMEYPKLKLTLRPVLRMVGIGGMDESLDEGGGGKVSLRQKLKKLKAGTANIAAPVMGMLTKKGFIKIEGGEPVITPKGEDLIAGKIKEDDYDEAVDEAAISPDTLKQPVLLKNEVEQAVREYDLKGKVKITYGKAGSKKFAKLTPVGIDVTDLNFKRFGHDANGQMVKLTKNKTVLYVPLDESEDLDEATGTRVYYYNMKGSELISVPPAARVHGYSGRWPSYKGGNGKVKKSPKGVEYMIVDEIKYDVGTGKDKVITAKLFGNKKMWVKDWMKHTGGTQVDRFLLVPKGGDTEPGDMPESFDTDAPGEAELTEAEKKAMGTAAFKAWLDKAAKKKKAKKESEDDDYELDEGRDRTNLAAVEKEAKEYAKRDGMTMHIVKPIKGTGQAPGYRIINDKTWKVHKGKPGYTDNLHVKTIEEGDLDEGLSGPGYKLSWRGDHYVVSIKSKDGKGWYAIHMRKAVDDEDEAVKLAKKWVKDIKAGVKMGDLEEADEGAGDVIDLDEAGGFESGKVYKPKNGKRNYVYVAASGGGTLVALSGGDKGSEASYQLDPDEWTEVKGAKVEFTGAQADKRKQAVKFKIRISKAENRELAKALGEADEDEDYDDFMDETMLEEGSIPQWAKDALAAIGGNKALFMMGAKDIVYDNKDKSVRMRIGRNKAGATHLFITLTSMDLYDLALKSIRKKKGSFEYSTKDKAKLDGAYVDMVKPWIEKETGLRLKLF